ncbi:MAG: glycoside hydrolase family 3 protein, partial [Vibrio sp.]|nr:glycoside hydrolase family 3 protein [Vibrio sp.]
VSFEIKVLRAATEPVYLSLQRAVVPGCLGDIDNVVKVDVSHYFSTINDSFTRVNIACSHFSEQGLSFTHLDTPFSLFTNGECQFVIANICWDTQ